MLSATFAGLLVARSLGVEGRGDYAAVVAWFGFTLIVGEIGQTAATTYFVARHESLARHYMATSRNMMIATGALATVLGMALAPLLGGRENELVHAYRLCFAACVPAFLGATYTSGLQAAHIRTWNAIRLLQPASYLCVIAVMFMTGRLTLTSAVFALLGSVTVQAVVSFRLASRRGLTGGRADMALAREMTSYGVRQVAASVPAAVNTRLDQLVLSQAANSATLGSYAVATTISSLASPVVAAVGSVMFPRLASGTGGDSALIRRVVKVTWVLAIGISLMVALAARWVVPIAFGESFRPAIKLVWYLTPGGIFLAVGLVAGDLLRGNRLPGVVARAQLVGALVTVALVGALIPPFGAEGAAIASSVAYGVALVMMRRGLR